MKTILLMGQSNATGYGDDGPWDIDPSVTCWNSGANRIDLLDLGTAWVTPDRNAAPFYDGKNNQGIHAANYLAKLTGQPVRLIIVSRNGQSIKKWHTSLEKGPMYDRMLAVLNAAGVSSVDWFLWNQGSADNGYAEYYAPKFAALLAHMQADGIITSTTPVVTSETAFRTTAINDALQAIADSDPRCEMAKIGHYPTHDEVHFTGQSLERAGWESVYSLSKIPGPFQGIVPMPDLSNYVYATGNEEMTLASGANVRIVWGPRYGNLNLISGGNFVALQGGLHRFSIDASAMTNKVKVHLRDGLNQFIGTVCWTGPEDPAGNSPTLHGNMVLNLSPGDEIRVLINQDSGATKVLSASHSNAFNRMEVTYLG